MDRRTLGHPGRKGDVHLEGLRDLGEKEKVEERRVSMAGRDWKVE